MTIAEWVDTGRRILMEIMRASADEHRKRMAKVIFGPMARADASEVANGWAMDELDPEARFTWTISNNCTPRITSLFSVTGEAVSLADCIRRTGWEFEQTPKMSLFRSSDASAGLKGLPSGNLKT